MNTEKFRVGLVQMSCALDPNENLEKAIWRRSRSGRTGRANRLPSGTVPLAVFLPGRKRRAVCFGRADSRADHRNARHAWRASSGS